MLVEWWNHTSVRPLAVGLLWGALYILAAQSGWRLTRRLERAPRAELIRLLRWAGWSPLERAWTALYASAYLLAALLGGALAASDVGLGAIDWPLVWPWALGLTAGAATWLALLWGGHGRTKTLVHRGAGPRNETALWALARLARHEAELAIWRAALAPALGLYWGVWLAVFAKWLLSRANPALNARLGDAAQRPQIVLDWALDWVSSVLFTFTGSLWLAFGGRVICHLVVAIAQGRAARRNATPADGLSSSG